MFIRGCDSELKPVRKLLEDVENTVVDVLEYYGETDQNITAIEQLFKNITAFSKVYVVEQKTQEKAPGQNKITPQKPKSTVAA